ncbi:hypothetical protein MCC00328_12260 [Bifidobacterium longum subsp. longum]|nr:hypothetical protein MCC00328_12260 [Bifidobacterium longum subsp. longum]
MESSPEVELPQAAKAPRDIAATAAIATADLTVRFIIEPFSFIVDPAVPGQDRYASTHLYDYRHALLCNGLLHFANDSNIGAS